jgi:hypothetical protein
MAGGATFSSRNCLFGAYRSLHPHRPVARQTVTKVLEGHLVFTAREDRSYEFSTAACNEAVCYREQSYRVSGVPEGRFVELPDANIARALVLGSTRRLSVPR